MNASQLAYAQVDPDFKIVAHSPNFGPILTESKIDCVGQPLVDVLTALAGGEEVLKQVLTGARASYELPLVKQDQTDDERHRSAYSVPPPSFQ